MTADLASSALWLDTRPGGVFCMHNPATGPVGVVIVPPFGWQELCSYRARREWAVRLAAAGHPVLRLDLPATGDSTGNPRDDDLVERWITAVTGAAAWLRAEDDCERVVALGIGLGGLLAHAAAAHGGAIDDLILWGTPARGRALVREWRATSRMEEEQLGVALGLDDADAGSLVVGGFALQPATLASLESLDLSELGFDGSGRHVLLLERDRISVDERLRSALEASGATVTVAPGSGYAGMLAEPHDARAPLETIDRTIEWIGGIPAAARGPATPAPRSTHQIELGDGIVEETFVLNQPFGRLHGVIARPAASSAPLTAVVLNAGAIRRTGPGRVWVEAARRWAARGIPTVRLDLEGIGEADGDGEQFSSVEAFYTPEMLGQVRAALSAFAEQGLPERFVLAGLCSGSFWSFHTAVSDPRVPSVVMLNPRLMVWDAYRVDRREAKRVGKAMDVAKIGEVLRGEKSLSLVFAIARAILATALRFPQRAVERIRARLQRSDDDDKALDAFHRAGKRAVIGFSGDEPLFNEYEHEGRLARFDRWPNVRLETTQIADHTLRPLALQRWAHQMIDLGIEDELSRLPAPAAATPS